MRAIRAAEAAGDEQHVILVVQREPGKPFTFAAEIVMRRDGHRLGVDNSDVGLVLDDYIEMALAVRGRLLRSATQIDRADHMTIM